MRGLVPRVHGVTGKYFKKTHVIGQNPIAMNDGDARRLWQISEQLTAAAVAARHPAPS